MRLRNVAVHKHHLTVAFKREAPREVDGREGLAFARQRTSDDHDIAKPQLILACHSRQQRSLDNPVLGRNLTLLVCRGHQANSLQRRHIDTNRTIAAERYDDDRGWGIRCLRDLTAFDQVTVRLPERLRFGVDRPLGTCTLEQFHGLFDETHGLACKIGHEAAAHVTGKDHADENDEQCRAGGRDLQHFHALADSRVVQATWH